MTQYNILGIKLCNLQRNQLKSGIKNGTDITLNVSSNVIGNSNDEANFPHKLLLTSMQVSRLRKTFANDSSGTIKLSKTQLSKNKKSGGFLGRLFRLLLKLVCL